MHHSNLGVSGTSRLAAWSPGRLTSCERRHGIYVHMRLGMDARKMCTGFYAGKVNGMPTEKEIMVTSENLESCVISRCRAGCGQKDASASPPSCIGQ